METKECQELIGFEESFNVRLARGVWLDNESANITIAVQKIKMCTCQRVQPYMDHSCDRTTTQTSRPFMTGFPNWGYGNSRPVTHEGGTRFASSQVG